MELQHQDAVIGKPLGCRVDEASVRVETVAGREHGGERLVRKLRMLGSRVRRQVRQVRDDHVEAPGDGSKEIAVANEHAPLEAMPTYVRGCEEARRSAAVDRRYDS